MSLWSPNISTKQVENLCDVLKNFKNLKELNILYSKSEKIKTKKDKLDILVQLPISSINLDRVIEEKKFLTEKNDSQMKPQQSKKKKQTLLHWKQRPRKIVKNINQAFDKIKNKDHSDWGLTNGAKKYYMLNIDEHLLIKKMILDMPGKLITIMDLGAGNFQFGSGIVNYIESLKNFPNGSHVRIISLRGEKYTGNEIERTKRCTHYKFGTFKLEDLIEELKKRGLAFAIGQDATINFIHSRWTLTHLADGIGTHMQAYNIMKPDTGYFMFEGLKFARYINDEKVRNENMKDIRSNMVSFLDELGADYLMEHDTSSHNFDNFIARKPPAAKSFESISWEYRENLTNNGLKTYNLGAHANASFNVPIHSHKKPTYIKPFIYKEKSTIIEDGLYLSDNDGSSSDALVKEYLKGLYGSRNIFDSLTSLPGILTGKEQHVPLIKKRDIELFSPFKNKFDEDLKSTDEKISLLNELDKLISVFSK